MDDRTKRALFGVGAVAVLVGLFLLSRLPFGELVNAVLALMGGF